MVDIDASVNDVDIDALSTRRFVFILGEGTETEPWAVTDASEALKK
jgi:hypothetical protein